MKPAAPTPATVAEQAGSIAHQAGVKTLYPIHYPTGAPTLPRC
jgi:ribonuclease BN (tRNA processing enzyme)